MHLAWCHLRLAAWVKSKYCFLETQGQASVPATEEAATEVAADSEGDGTGASKEQELEKEEENRSPQGGREGHAAAEARADEVQQQQHEGQAAAEVPAGESAASMDEDEAAEEEEPALPRRSGRAGTSARPQRKVDFKFLLDFFI